MVNRIRRSLWLVLPVLLLVALYWPGLTSWFQQDDFAWLSLRQDLHSMRDLGSVLLAPKAHGNMRPLGENSYWLVLSVLFGMNALPFHLVAFGTQAASLVLMAEILRRLTGSRWIGCCAAVLWTVNAGLAPALGWCSIYNQILSGFFLLLGFYFLLRWIESGGQRFAMAHWVAFVLGLGALEINVVYPALATLYALLFARKYVTRILPMFAASAVVMALHFHFAPLTASGVYSPRVDGAMFGTLWWYWKEAVGEAAAPYIAGIMIGLALIPPLRFNPRLDWSKGMPRVADAATQPLPDGRGSVGPSSTQPLGPKGYPGRGSVGPSEPRPSGSGWRLALLGLGWFVITVLPYLPLPEHKMSYYLAVPAIGIALLGASGIRRGYVLAWIGIALFIVPSVKASWTITQWQHDRAEKMENLVLGVEEARERAPGKAILLDGIDNDLFWSGVLDLPFRAAEIPQVYLAPGSEDRIQAAPELLTKYVLPARLASGALVYRFDGELLHREPARKWSDDYPRFVNLGDPAFAAMLGSGWRPAEESGRRTQEHATFHIAGPSKAGESLYLGVEDPRPFTWKVRVNGVEAGAQPMPRANGPTWFRVPLGPELVGAKSMEVSVESGLEYGILFGYAEVR